MRVAITLCPKKASFAPMLFTGRMEHGIHRAAELGCDAVELNVQNPALIDTVATAELIASLGLTVTGIGTGQAYYEEGLSISDTDTKVHEAAIRRLKVQVDFAQQLGGAAVIIGGMRGKLDGSPGGKSWSEQRQASIEGTRAAAYYAAGRGVRVLIEPINRYETNFINSIAQGLEYLDEIDHSNVSLLADTFHMNIEEVSLADSILAAGERLTYMHLVDSNRRAAGMGHTDFKAVIGALHEIGYDGPLCAEVIPLPDDETAARQHVEFVRANW